MPLILLLLLASSLSLFAQGGESPNIVPNPDFERLSRRQIGWFYNGKHFSETMKYWNSPTSASPDIYGPSIRVPRHWADKGFGDQTAQSGSNMIGLTCYGCVEGKPHCREYIQIQLAEQLVVGQKYFAEMWVSHLPRSLRINNLGIAFLIDDIHLSIDTAIHLQPQIRVRPVIHAPNHKWLRLSGYFTAEEPGNYLILGNFFSDKDTRAVRIGKNSLNYAYYYIDNITVRKVPPILAVPVPEDDLTLIELEKGKVIGLKDIFFDFDRYELLPRSFVELKKLVKIMNENPRMVIEVRGHTDSYGGDGYNIELSRRRAESVVSYLLEKGISPERIRHKGLGESEPIASNLTDEGRQMNRRVEFLILEM